ncbi:ubiquinone/menaquinone biosynthesis methyltransferase protein [Hyaloraphidium curvatum]|nr:ubiquinone/menaquinone biosynthesis methyltransferase protein [Hyaloraphidium curvatum]
MAEKRTGTARDASTEAKVEEHYTRRDSPLEAAVLDAVGGDVKSHDDLAQVDEFHYGGRTATVALADLMQLRPGIKILDVGSGIGGPARYFASRGCDVTGVDLTEDFVATATSLTARVGLEDRARFVRASALEMPFADGSFEGAYMIHVGMNIGDKGALFREVRRVLAPNSTFVIFDIMRTKDGDLTFPVPWASVPEASFVTPAAEYRRALVEAGFDVVEDKPRTDFNQAPQPGVKVPPSVLVTLERRVNLMSNMKRGLVVPTMMIARAVRMLPGL